MVIPVTERSEDTGLVYPSVCEITSLLKNRARSPKKVILAISCQKIKKIVKTNKKVREKSL